MKFFELQRELDKCHNGIWSAVGSIREAVCNPEDFAFILADQRIRLEAYIDRTLALLDHGVSIPDACPNYWIENRTHILTGLRAMKEALEVELNWRTAELKGTCNYLLAESDPVLRVLRMLADSPFSSANEGVDQTVQTAKKVASFKEGGTEPPTETVEEVENPKPNGLADDGLSLRWGGKLYSIKPTAAQIIRLLVDSFDRGFPYLSEDYLKTESDTDTDMRHLVRNGGLSDVVIREIGSNGNIVKGKWGLIDPKKIASVQEMPR